MNFPRTTKLAFAALALALFPCGRALSLEPRPLPGYVLEMAGENPRPSARPWELDPALAGPNALVPLPDALGELKPEPLPAVPIPNPSGDPVVELLNDGLDALRVNRVDEASFAFTTGMRAPAQTPAVDACAFWLGEVRRQKGLKDEAAVAYAKVRGELKSEATYRLSRLLESGWQADTARRYWRAIAEDPVSTHRAEATYRLAELEKDPEAALALLTRTLQAVNPSSDLAAAANYRLAAALRATSRLREAERTLSTLLLARPDHPAARPARVLRGWVDLEQGHREEAARALAEADRESGLPGEVKVRALYGLAVLAARSGNSEEYGRTLSLLALDTQGPWAGWACAARGAALLAAGQKPAALGAYHEALALWRLDGLDAVRFTVGELHLELREYRESANAFAAIDPGYRGAPEALRRGASALSAAGERASAKNLLERLLLEFPEYEERDSARIELANELLASGRREEAVAALEAASPGTPGRELLLFLRGETALGRGLYFEAAEQFEKYEKSATGEKLRASLLNHARALKELEQPEEAAQRYLAAAALSKNPGDVAEARLEAGLLLLGVGNGEKGANELARLLAEGAAGLTADRAHYALAEYRNDRGEYEEARRHYAAAAVSTDSALALLARKGEGASLAALGKNEEALKVYAALGDDPDSLAGAALALGKLGRVVEMAAAVAKFGAHYPEDPLVGELDLKLADALTVEGRSADAAEYYGKAASRFTGARRDKALYMRGVALEGAGRVEEAAALYGQLGAKVSDPATRLLAARRLAMLDLASGKPAQAAERLRGLLKGAREGDQSEAGLLNDLAEASLAAGDLEGGYEALRRASAVAEGEEKLKTDFLLGEFLEKSGKVNAALETYQRIAYHYDLAQPLAAKATLAGAALLVRAGRLEEAKELYRLAAKGAKGASAKKAAQELKELEGAPERGDGNR